MTAGGPDVCVAWASGRRQVWAEGGVPHGARGAVQLQGTLRIILDPLLVDKPFVGAVTVFFLQKPVSPRTPGRPATPGRERHLPGPRRWA